MNINKFIQDKKMRKLNERIIQDALDILQGDLTEKERKIFDIEYKKEKARQKSGSDTFIQHWSFLLKWLYDATMANNKKKKKMIISQIRNKIKMIQKYHNKNESWKERIEFYLSSIIIL